jgi:hypothetical protein
MTRRFPHSLHVHQFAQSIVFGVLSGIEKLISYVFSVNRDIPPPASTISGGRREIHRLRLRRWGGGHSPNRSGRWGSGPR